jgi:hypothetical protein
MKLRRVGEAVVEQDQGVGHDDTENNVQDDLREEANNDQGIQVEMAPAPVDDPSVGCATGQGSDMGNKMIENLSFQTEEPVPEQ